MSLTFGFYNSHNHDRVYDAIQVSSIFDGIINDGVYMSIGDRFMVKPLSGMQITVGTGRAWFDHTWSLNDSLLPLEVEPAELVLNRVDTVVLEVNEDARENYIFIVKGTPGSDPSPPALINNDSVHQHPLADIRVNRGAMSITQANIVNRVGTSACPFVTGIIETINIDSLIAQWGAEWEEWSVNHANEFEDWFGAKRVEYQQLINAFDSETDQFLSDKRSEFEAWFQALQNILDGDIATRLAERITKLENRWTLLGKKYEYRDTIDGTDNTAIVASDGTTISGRVVYALVE